MFNALNTEEAALWAKAKPFICTESCLQKAITPLTPPLIAASLLGDLHGVIACLAAGENPDVMDEFGYTASHWAACHPRLDILEVLSRQGADWRKAIATGATVLDLLAARIPNYPDRIQPFIDDRSFSAEEYVLQFGSRFMPYPWFTSRAMLTFRSCVVFSKIDQKDPIRHYVEDRYHAMRQSGGLEAPSIYLQHMHYRDDGSVLPETLWNQWEAHASKRIPAGEPILLYSGTVYDQLWLVYEGQPSDRTMNIRDWPVPLCVDAEGADGMAGFINHGPPKLDTLTIIDRGLPVVALYALKDIEAGEMLTYSYDDSGQWFEAQGLAFEELAPEILRAFIHKTEGLMKLDWMEYQGDTVSYTFEEGVMLHSDPDARSLSRLFEARWNAQMVMYLLQAKRWKRWYEQGLLFEASIEGLASRLFAN